MRVSWSVTILLSFSGAVARGTRFHEEPGVTETCESEYRDFETSVEKEGLNRWDPRVDNELSKPPRGPDVRVVHSTRLTCQRWPVPCPAVKPKEEFRARKFQTLLALARMK